MNQAQTDSAFVAGAKDMLNYYINTWLCPYGMPAGMVMRLEGGTGLGGGVTHVDGKPVDSTATVDLGEYPAINAGISPHSNAIPVKPISKKKPKRKK